MEDTMNNIPAGPAGKFRNSNLAQAWLVLLLAMCFGGALATMQVNLSDIIAANKLNETLERIPELVKGPQSTQVTAADKSELKILPGTLTVEKENKSKTYSVFQATRLGNPVGWVVKAGGQGYADKIELLVGLDPQLETITGLFILEQKETPGLGNKIIFPEWRGQFIGKKTLDPLTVVKGSTTAKGTAIDAITGATISSVAVTDIINQTTSAMKGQLTPSTVKFIERQD